MSKDAKKLSNSNWCPHDLDCTSDPKLVALMGKFGALGYAVFWRITEILHKEPEHKISTLDEFIFIGIAEQLKANAKQVLEVIDYMVVPCQLMKRNADFISSNRVFRNIERKNEIVDKRKEAGSLGGKSKANAKQVLTKSLPNAKQNVAEERRGDKISIDILSNISSLQDSLKGTPTLERLWRAFVSAYPRKYAGSEMQTAERIFRDYEPAKCSELISNLAMDLEMHGVDLADFDDVVTYISI